MNILRRLLIIFACAIVVVNAATRDAPTGFVDVDLGDKAESAVVVIAKSDISKQQGAAQVTARDDENALH